jgi:outer membrane protein OmpA-like peptidoglycan-associated protein
MHIMRAIGLVLALGTILAACASKDNLVVVLPEGDGHVGAVVVHDASGGGDALLLDKAYAAAGGGSGAHAVRPIDVDPAESRQIFGGALAAQPIPPQTFRLYFVSDSDTLTADSKAAFEAVFADIARRKAAEVVVTGHTDTIGELDYNDSLSRKRADAVRALLIGRGLPAASIVTAGRGKRELLVKTADQVSEPRNRRVEITVR